MFFFYPRPDFLLLKKSCNMSQKILIQCGRKRLNIFYSCTQLINQQFLSCFAKNPSSCCRKFCQKSDFYATFTNNNTTSFYNFLPTSIHKDASLSLKNLIQGSRQKVRNRNSFCPCFDHLCRDPCGGKLCLYSQL